MKLNEVHRILKESEDLRKIEGLTDEGTKFSAYKIGNNVRIDIDDK